MAPPRQIARLLLVLAIGSGVLLAGCASMAPSRESSSERNVPVLLCNIDSLRWGRGFAPRADTRDCVAILETVRLRH